LSPRYIYQHKSSWIFRIRVPADLRGIIHKTELRYSLRTGSIAEAKYKARRAAGQIQRLFRVLRKEKHMAAELTDERIQEIVREMIKEIVKAEEHPIFGPDPDGGREDYLNWASIPSMLETDYKKALHYRDYSRVHGQADEIFKEHDLEIDRDSDLYKRLCRQLLIGSIKGMELSYEMRLNPMFDLNEILARIDQIGQASPPQLQRQQEETTSAKLSEIIKAYKEENLAAGNWKSSTLSEYETCFRLLLEFFGDVPVHTITYAWMRDFKEALLKLPKYPNSKKYRGRSIKEILEMDIEETKAITTINDKYLGPTSGLLNFALKNHYIEFNPAEGLQIKQKQGIEKKVYPYNKDDLHTIFNNPEYANDTHSKPHRFWLPVLALYTGCRLEEMAQLYTDDVRQEAGVWVLDINEKTPDKSVKDSKQRLIPLHPFLVEDLQFPEFVQKIINEGHDRLFPYLRMVNGKYSHGYSQEYSKKRKKWGITGSDKNFHSFRHTFIDYLAKHDFNQSIAYQLEGHADPTVSKARKHYLTKYTPDVLFDEVVSKIDYGVDLSHLKSSKYVKASTD